MFQVLQISLYFVAKYTVFLVYQQRCGVLVNSQFQPCKWIGIEIGIEIGIGIDKIIFIFVQTKQSIT